ncbi:carbonic anhydrase/acetyltransferase-like protein (isoleucine patch superfamily) [Hasllibacter halocynthiae]|uniref:Carbonic anhydrase/acetyltransferase-like protein (Isoleucine patch superfamily) n=1 Tax=Hasllibacter halocynthiae TaxID=595589 RepID=A0A2T0X871_9RHOB|nr:gamma carbonic anhydrase family protein [Hasllibacter halocynthiae]PRY95129.1 carbonic anhydrase/acetyltransferase-like protein (isoleucine patch superfamily) [Hasllibacter halocynthiae]
MIYALGKTAPKIHPDAWIAPDANIIGDVVVEAGASVWFGTTIRGDNERITVGAGSNVQEGCVLHTDMGFPLVIGPDCTVGHGAILHGCTLADTVLVGMGATVLNGAVVGRLSLVGAGALLTEGKTFGERSLIVGAPAKVARALDGDAAKMLAASAAHYRENAARFRDGLAPVRDR